MSKPKKADSTMRGYSDEDLEDVLDNPEWTEEDFARARPAREMLPPELYEKLVKLSDEARAKAARKRPVPLRLDPDVLERLRAEAPGWQERANAILRKAVGLEVPLTPQGLSRRVARVDDRQAIAPRVGSTTARVPTGTRR